MSKYNNILVLDGVKYSPFEYIEEKTLEKDVNRNIKYIFGENAWPIPKLKIKPSEGSGRIPDLYALDISAKKLYVIEVERISHSIPDHITPQISGFYRILSDTSSRADLLDKLYDETTKNIALRNAFKDIGVEEIHKFLADILMQSYEVVLIIDKITKELKNAFRYTNPIPRILEFKRFKRSDADVFIYEMDTLERGVTLTDSNLNIAFNKNVHSEKIDKSSNKKIRSVSINSQHIDTNSARGILINTFKWLLNNGYLKNIPMPLKSGNVRYVVSTSPLDQDGRPFRSPRKVGDYYIECHNSYDRSIYLAKQLLKSAGLNPDILKIETW